MRIFFVSFADGYKFAFNRKRIKKEAKNLCLFDNIRVYSLKDLPIQLKLSPVMLYERGSGYWSWKPWVILDTLNRASFGDIVVYTDGGSTLHNNPDEWKEKIITPMSEYDMQVVQYRDAWLSNEAWTKNSLVDFFTSAGANTDWVSQPQIAANFMVMKKCPSVIRLIEDWFKIVFFRQDLLIDVFGPERFHQQKCFQEHRHDQSILSGLILTQTEAKIKIIPDEIDYYHAETPFITISRIRKKDDYIPIKKRIRKKIMTLIGSKNLNSVRKIIKGFQI